MSFFSTGIFWLIEGVLLSLSIAGLKIWLEDRDIAPPLWQWVLLVGWILLCGFTISFVGTSLGENETVAAAKGGMLFGLIAAISGAGLWRLVVTKATGRHTDAQ
ncbi:MAG: hypothetical protein HOC20_14165 [Chloroflexi bacterium]|jgi:hypothetical protein|nr:hypothetical protein [Chloroflexota bacterium]